MRQYFVLDENVIVLAQTLRDENGQDDATCRDLLRAMLFNCHSLVLAYPSMWAKYSRQVSILGLYTEVMGILKSILIDAAKDARVLSDDECPRLDELEGMLGVDEGDRPFVAAAASVSGSVLVTTDGALWNALSSHGMDLKHGFLMATPADALRLAEPY